MSVEDQNVPVSISSEDVERLLRHLMLPLEAELPSAPLDFLSTHLGSLPEPLAVLFSPVTTPRQRSTIPRIKSRRLTFACTIPPPAELQAESGRRRWPLLWERMGGDRGPLTVPAGRQVPLSGLEEEERFGSKDFMDGRLDAQAVKRLGGLLRDFEEEREAERGLEARRAERRREENVGEEFDEESDEEEFEEQRRQIGLDDQADQVEVRELFEKRLAELFIDGLDVRLSILLS